MALMIFWGGLLVGAVGVITDNVIALGLGIPVAFIGVVMWRKQ